MFPSPSAQWKPHYFFLPLGRWQMMGGFGKTETHQRNSNREPPTKMWCYLAQRTRVQKQCNSRTVLSALKRRSPNRKQPLAKAEQRPQGVVITAISTSTSLSPEPTHSVISLKWLIVAPSLPHAVLRLPLCAKEVQSITLSHKGYLFGGRISHCTRCLC